MRCNDEWTDGVVVVADLTAAVFAVGSIDVTAWGQIDGLQGDLDKRRVEVENP